MKARQVAEKRQRELDQKKSEQDRRLQEEQANKDLMSSVDPLHQRQKMPQQLPAATGAALQPGVHFTITIIIAGAHATPQILLHSQQVPLPEPHDAPARQGDLLHFDHNEYPTSNDVTSMFNSMSIIAPHPPAPHAAQVGN